MSYYFHFSSFLGEKTFQINLKIQDWTIPILFNILVLLDVITDLSARNQTIFFCTFFLIDK